MCKCTSPKLHTCLQRQHQLHERLNLFDSCTDGRSSAHWYKFRIDDPDLCDRLSSFGNIDFYSITFAELESLWFDSMKPAEYTVKPVKKERSLLKAVWYKFRNIDISDCEKPPEYEAIPPVTSISLVYSEQQFTSTSNVYNVNSVDVYDALASLDDDVDLHFPDTITGKPVVLKSSGRLANWLNNPIMTYDAKFYLELTRKQFHLQRYLISVARNSRVIIAEERYFNEIINLFEISAYNEYSVPFKRYCEYFITSDTSLSVHAKSFAYYRDGSLYGPDFVISSRYGGLGLLDWQC